MTDAKEQVKTLLASGHIRLRTAVMYHDLKDEGIVVTEELKEFAKQWARTYRNYAQRVGNARHAKKSKLLAKIRDGHPEMYARIMGNIESKRKAREFHKRQREELERQEREWAEAQRMANYPQVGDEVMRSKAYSVYCGSNGVATRAYYRFLGSTGLPGRIAAQLMRCQKASSRAKQYRGGTTMASYRDLAYARKGECLKALCALLSEQEEVAWGWNEDPETEIAPHVLYVELPTGQVSFHSDQAFSDKRYAGEWDKQYLSEERILAFCASFEAVGSCPRTGVTTATPVFQVHFGSQPRPLL
jgi:hypothetical protein